MFIFRYVCVWILSELHILLFSVYVILFVFVLLICMLMFSHCYYPMGEAFKFSYHDQDTVHLSSFFCACCTWYAWWMKSMSNFPMSAGTHELPVSLFQWLESNLFQLHSCSTLLTNVGIVEGEQLEHAYAQWFVDVALGSFCFGLMGWWSRNNFRVPEASRCGRRERRNSGLSHVVQHCFFFLGRRFDIVCADWHHM